MAAPTIEEILIDADSRGWDALPDATCHALEQANAPARLIAHLVLVHHTAESIVEAVRANWPKLDLDWHAIALGASIHDIGKALAKDELTGPGKLHELAGESFLVEIGVAPEIARFARTHGLPVDDESLLAEDLLVILADKLWKGSRDQVLEERIALTLSLETRLEFWDVYPRVLDLCESIGAGSDERLAWQSAHSPGQ